MPGEATAAGAALGTGISPGLGTLLGAGVGGVADIATSAFNVHESRQNRRFQRDMANTAHQREVKDLIKAGLNPILSAKFGGAATPPTSAAQIMSPVQGAKTGADLVAQKQNQDLVKAQTRNLNAQARSAEVDATVKEFGLPFLQQHPQMDAALKMNEVFKSDVEVSPEALRAMAQKIVDDASAAHSQAALLKGQIPAAFNQSEMAKTWYGRKILPYIRSILDASGVYKNVK